MKKEFWHARWQSNQIAFDQLQPNEFMRLFFKRLHLKPGSRVFVPLCGKSIDMLWLANHEYEVIGVELSTIACESFFNNNSIAVKKIQGDKFTIYQSDKITLLSGDFFDLNKTLVGTFDAVYDRAALIALPGELRQRYATFLMSLLEPGTPMFLISNTYSQNEMQGPPFSVDEAEVIKLYGEHFTIDKLCSQDNLNIPEHLKVRGLTKASDEVYYLSDFEP